MELHPERPLNSKQQFFELGKGKFIPKDIRFYAGHFQSQGDRLDLWRKNTAQEVEQYVKWAPAYLQDELFYRPFCEKEGSMTETIVQTPIGEIKVSRPQIPFREQTLENLVGDIKLQEFMANYTPPREALLKAVKETIGKLPRRDARYLSPDIQRFDESMQTGSYKIALALIPDLMDREAKDIFGQLTSLLEIRRRVTMQENV